MQQFIMHTVTFVCFYSYRAARRRPNLILNYRFPPQISALVQDWLKCFSSHKTKWDTRTSGRVRTPFLIQRASEMHVKNWNPGNSSLAKARYLRVGMLMSSAGFFNWHWTASFNEQCFCLTKDKELWWSTCTKKKQKLARTSMEIDADLIWSFQQTGV